MVYIPASDDVVPTADVLSGHGDFTAWIPGGMSGLRIPPCLVMIHIRVLMIGTTSYH